MVRIGRVWAFIERSLSINICLSAGRTFFWFYLIYFLDVTRFVLVDSVPRCCLLHLAFEVTFRYQIKFVYNRNTSN